MKWSFCVRLERSLLISNHINLLTSPLDRIVPLALFKCSASVPTTLGLKAAAAASAAGVIVFGDSLP